MPFGVLRFFDLNGASVSIKPFGNGLINHTWRVAVDDSEYILQKINHHIFKVPEDLAFNIKHITRHISDAYPGCTMAQPVVAQNGQDVVYKEADGYYRVFPFISGSHSKVKCESVKQAFEAARQFGRFAHMLSDFDASLLRPTIPFFHDLCVRCREFSQALEMGNKERMANAATLIDFLQQQSGIVEKFIAIESDEAFKVRATHSDTKISNVLFDDADNGICVIDLDTVMPGYFISDVGDMLRTYLSPVTEEESDFSKIVIRDDYYKAVVQGYYGEMEADLSEKEKRHFFYAGEFMIYMQALRFLTDYLNDDVYYGARYDDHNLVRAGNQAILLERYLEKECLLGGYLPESAVSK